MTKTILVTGASGQLGRLTIEALLARGVEPGSIIAASRTPDKLADFAAKGVTLRKADFDDAASLKAAFAGVDTLAILSTEDIFTPGRRLAQHLAAVNAAKDAGVSHLVYTSMPAPEPDSPISFAPDHRGTEDAINASGLNHTILRNSWYQENLLQSLPGALASGQWFNSAGDGQVAHIARADCAAALAAVLTGDFATSRTLTLTGPDLLTTADIAALATKATGKPLVAITLTDEQLKGGLLQHGLPEAVANLIVSFDANTRQGRIAIKTDAVEELTGRKPRSMADFMAANKAVLAG